MKSNDIQSALMKADTKPGTVLYTGDKKQEVSTITLISYDKVHYSSSEVQFDDLNHLDSTKVNWIDIAGLHDVELIEKIGKLFSFDSMLLEDIVTVRTRPKYDKYDGYSYVIMSMLSLENQDNVNHGKQSHLSSKRKFFKNEQLSLVIIGNTILTFQEDKKDVFDHIRKRMIDNKSKIRALKSSYLFYLLIDAVVDQYFYILNAFEEKMELLEKNIMISPDRAQSKGIYHLRSELLHIRNSIWPTRDILNSLISEETIFIASEIRYLKDVNDNIKQIMDLISTNQELVMGLYETYLSNLSNKMNRIMTTLTMISVIFMPLTFLAGVYGMNFRYFPELSFKYSYPIFWIVCVVISIGLYRLFKKKNWFM